MTRQALIRLFDAASVADADELVTALFAGYHDLDGILCADWHALVNMIGERAAMLVKLSAAISSRKDTEKMKIGSRYDPDTLYTYMTALFRGSSVEMVYAICFDSAERLLSVDLVAEGTVNSSTITPRKLADIAVKNRTASMVIAHNHPGGRAMPSSSDLSFTDSVREVLESIGVRLIAHYAVASGECVKV